MRLEHARRNRMIAIVAGAITVIAIVLGFAGDFLGLPWHWMRPAAELLLLAELVGLVVLERHQLFEPVHETVSEMNSRLGELQLGFAALTKDLRLDGHVTLYASPAEILRAITLVSREALARGQEGPQILRLAALSGLMFAEDDREAVLEMQEILPALSAYFVTKASPADARARRWSVRLLAGAASVTTFERMREMVTTMYTLEPLNLEIKLFAKSRAESLLSPQSITDQDVVLVFDDTSAAFRWGLVLEGGRYAAPFARWFDDLWANLPNTHLVCSRNGINQNALDHIRTELEAIESSQARRNT